MSLLRATPPAAKVTAMLRFQMEIPLMIKRWRKEWEFHGRDFGNCHCGRGMNTMRKHRVYESHPSSSCGLCAGIRGMRKTENRTQRYFKSYYILEGLNEYES